MQHTRTIYPDRVTVKLQHHPEPWSDGSSSDEYQFCCIGRSWGARWRVDAVWANRTEPPGMTPRSLASLKSFISKSLEAQLKREIPSWGNSILAWE